MLASVRTALPLSAANAGCLLPGYYPGYEAYQQSYDQQQYAPVTSVAASTAIPASASPELPGLPVSQQLTADETPLPDPPASTAEVQPTPGQVSCV